MQRFGTILLLGLVAQVCFADQNTNDLRFNRDIRPILSENCLLCHGPDRNHRKAKLRLDVRDIALEKGAIVPGHPEKSHLVQRIFATNSDDIMPPPEAHRTLTLEEKETLRKWIAQGAVYEKHWAYVTPVRPPIPKVNDSAWVRNPIDAFVLSSLEDRHIMPSPAADRRTLLRRVSLDLTGLPPTVEEMEAFLHDSRPDAYERQVTRLLASPHFGERMAVPWLDAVRYADTVGYHGDQIQRVFPYRDYVINSFNENKPFDQFTIEQIAGDLLPNATTEQKIASGFNRLNMKTREGGAQPREYMAKYAADRVRTISGAWLGSTMGCCECHDHKYDPFLTRDFYSMEAFFADIKEWGYYAGGFAGPKELQGFGNDDPFPPEIAVTNKYLEERMARLKNEFVLETRHAAPGIDPAKFARWRHQALAFIHQHPDGWMNVQPTFFKPNTNAVIDPSGLVLFKRDPGKSEIAIAPGSSWIAALRVELIPQGSSNSILRDDADKTDIRFSVVLRPKHGKPQPLEFSVSDAARKRDNMFNGETVPGINSQWQPSGLHLRQSGIWELRHPVQTRPGDMLVLRFADHKAAAMRLAVSPFAAIDPLNCGADATLRRALSAWPVFRSRPQTELLRRAFLLDTDSSALAGLQKIQESLLACNHGRAYSEVTVAVPPRTIRVLPRGNWQIDTGDIVAPAVPHFLPQIPNPDGRRLTRLDLARWLVSKDNPLTARAIMNRMWKQFFGMGISSTVDDLGTQGDWPSHPELLDWLAVEFEDSGWNIKHMVRLIVLSDTYRQESNLRPELRETDPNNRLLSCQSPRRLEAEFVRDNALAIAGLLNLDVGGPSFYPYQPAGYYANLQFPERTYTADADDLEYRRGVYIHWQRTFLQPALDNFDAPSREEETCTRNVSNTPQQALTLLNDPTFVEAARVFAQDLLFAPVKGDAARLDLAFERAVCRPIKTEERQSLLEFLATQREHYRANPGEALALEHVGNATTPPGLNGPELAAWTSLCRVVLNMHETITVY